MSTRDPQPVCSLDEVIVTAELARRPSRSADFESENRALSALAEAMAQDPDAVLQALAESARELTGSESAALSLIEESEHGRSFRWKVIAGDLAHNEGDAP